MNLPLSANKSFLSHQLKLLSRVVYTYPRIMLHMQATSQRIVQVFSKGVLIYTVTYACCGIGNDPDGSTFKSFVSVHRFPSPSILTLDRLVSFKVINRPQKPRNISLQYIRTTDDVSDGHGVQNRHHGSSNLVCTLCSESGKLSLSQSSGYKLFHSLSTVRKCKNDKIVRTIRKVMVEYKI